jgi:hypothetical protein
MSAVFRCRAARRNAAALVVISMFAASSAYAQDATPPAAPAAAPAAPMMEAGRPLFSGTHFGIATSFSSDAQQQVPQVFLAANTGAVTWGIGITNFKYDGNAVPGPTNPMGDKTTADLVLSLGYMVHNQFPFAMGPEVNFIPSLAPKSFDVNVIQAGWAFWYAPFNIPCVIGTAAFVQVVIPPSPAKQIVTAVTPSVRIVFGFH